MRKVFTYGLVVTSAILLSACSSKGSTSNKQKTLNVMMIQEPSTADPNKGTDVYSASLVHQTLEGLYDVTNTGKVVPGVATKVVKPTNHGKTHTFTLKKNAKWQNGKPVTAEDFVTSFDRQVDPKTKSQYASRFQAFKNFADVQKGSKKPTALGVKALGQRKLRVTLTTPDPEFNFRAATEYYPLNTAAVKKYGQQYGTSSVKTLSNGAFSLQGWNPSKDAWTYKKTSISGMQRV